MSYDSSEPARRAAKKQSTLPGAGQGFSTRGSLFTDTHREDAKAYELPPTRSNHAATIKALRATGGSVSHAASGGASAAHSKPHVGGARLGAVPAPVPAASPGAGVSSTMDIVRAALGMHDESKVKELEELSSTLAAATANVTRSRRLSVSHVDQPGAPVLLPPSDPSAIAFSGDAIADLPRLRTGEDTIAFFLRYGPSCPVKFVTLVRQHKDDDDLFRPYDLRVVSPEDVKAEDAYFTMSGNGVVYIAPGEFSEFLSLAEWMRDASAFNICRSMRFFAQFLTRKTYLRWRGNVRFAKYMKQRASVRTKLFAWKPAFAGAIAEIGAQLSAMERVSLLDTSGSRYSFTTFAEAQSAARVIAGRALERSITSIQAAIDRVIIDVTRRAHPTGDEDDDEDEKARELKNKSMAAAKEAATRKAAALRDAQAEESVLGAFVRRTDYMIVETLSRIVTDAFGALRTELTDSDHRKSGVPGMFVTAVRFTPGSAGFDPSADELLGLVDMVVADTIKATDGCSRLLFARGFREYVQGLPTDGGPGVFGAPSVAALLQQSVAFAATHGGIEEKFHTDFANASTYVTAFDPVRPIWAYSQEFDFDKYRASEPSTYTLQKDMAKLKVWDTVLERMRTQHVEGCLFIDSKRLKQELEPITGQGIDRLKGLLMDTGRAKCRAVADAYLARAKVLDLRPSALDKFAGHVERLLGLRDAETALMKEASSVEDMFKLLSSYDVKITSEDAVALDDMRNAGLAYTDCYRKSESFLEERLPEMSRQLDMNILKVNDALKALADSVNEGMYVDAATPTATAVASLTEVLDKLAAAEAQTEVFTKWQTLFNTQPFEWHRLRSARKSVDTRAAVWNGLASWEAAHELWTRGKPFATVDVEELARDVQAASKASYATDKALGDSVTALWKSKVGDFKPCVGCVVDLGNKAMRDRHWRRIYEECGAPFVAGRSDERTLSELLAIGVLVKGELVGEMSGVASGEAQLEGSLQKIVEAWASTDFITKSYREQKGVYILGGLEEVMTQLEDHAVTLQTMMGSRFIQGVRDQVEAWEKRLSLLSDTLDEWLACQKQWMYLETIFSAEDIQRQLPAEAAKFSAIDRSWKDIMLKTKSKPNVMSSLDTGDMLLKSFTNNNVVLEQIQKSLEDYLETKRAGFPRFYFLSNDELLAILSQTRDPQAVQPHLQKCFDAIKSLAMAEDAEHVFQISGMVSSEGEKVPYPRSQQARGDVTEWLTAVEKEMRTSLYDHSKSALARYPSYEAAVERKDWYFTAPAQSIILVDQVVWTQNCAQALRDIASGKDKDAMPKFLEYTRKQLDNMVVLVRQDLTKLQRGLLGALTVIDVHARDVVTAMIGRKTGSLEEFEWTRQLRYYWEADVDNCVVRQTNTRFVYGYEYLGNCDRLVITPLTDQCYMTLTGALHLKLGGAPAGPAGTGKTETTKDLAKALANQCVVFNCSDGLDFMIMGRFFSGLAQAGAWACFDEFNRIDIEVLSVVAQQVMTIQQGLVARMPTIMFEGREIVLNQCFGVFITMNPGYAGRSELPDNLKSLFRPVAMMVPDYRLIAEIVLFSQGFADAVKLSYKMVQLYRLSSEQLSKQAHYDFGMRAVKSVLVAAGQLKRKEPDVDENILLIRAMRDSNVPKFLAQDLPLFGGILTDLFPSVEVPRVDRGKLLTAIEDQLDIVGLQRVPALITKIIETHETQLVRHGMMLVGESGSGKTACWQTLSRALGQLKRDGVIDKDSFFQVVNCSVLNPKSITMGEMYGEFNLATQEWRDGLVASLVRQACADTGPNRKWIMFDGPVDAIWIENMNTVLDDNKMLCLSNGERIKLPLTMHMMFEVRDLAVASPATVSRCGMVFMEPLHVGEEALVQTWAAGEIEDLLPAHAPKIAARILADVPRVLKFLRDKCVETIPSQDSNLVASFVNLLLALLRPENGVKAEGGNAYPRSAADKARDRYYATHGGAPGAGGDEGEGKEGEEKKDDDAKPAAAPAPAPAPVEEAGEEEEGSGKKVTSGAMEAGHLQRVIDQSYVFSLVWSFGANLHDGSRTRFIAFVHELLADLVPYDLRPKAAVAEADGAPAVAAMAGADLYGYYVDPEAGAMREWAARMPAFTYRTDLSYFSILVPSVDTTRFSYLFQTILASGRNVMFSGETGVGKSVIIADALARMCAGQGAQFVTANVNFSAQTTSGNLQEALEANLDKKRKNLLGPPAGKRMCVFVDDLNMPAKEKYGAQPPIELLRQVIDQGGFYDRQKLFFKQVASTLFATGCAPPGGGRSEVTTRLTRRFHLVWLPTLTLSSMSTIFNAILGGFLGLEAPDCVPFVADVVGASVDIYHRVQKDLLPTPAKSHYTFNLRDISKVFQGVLQARGKALADKDALLRLWLHEEQRVFRDRLISLEDRVWFNNACAELLESRLGVSWPVESFEGVLFGDYTTKGGGEAAKPYIEIADQSRLGALFGEFQEEFNMEGKAMQLVFFKDAIAHVSRIARILRQPRGNALLVGVGGSGRQSLTRLASFMADFKCSSIEITRGYGVNEWHDDLKKMLMTAGIKQMDTVFLFSDSQIVKESFLEDINNILNSGDVPNLYALDEMEQIINGCRAAAKAAGKPETKASIFLHYISLVREKLHIVLCMSPIGDAFRNRCRMFPSLVNCTTIDWFNAWPDDALNSVAGALLGGEGNKLDLGELVEPLCAMCVRIHQSVQDASVRYLAQQRRYNYTTPTSYLELLRLYTGMLNNQRDIVNKKIARYRGGLTKLSETNAMVAGLQAKLTDLQPVLEKAAADTATLLVQLEKDQKTADEQAAIAAKDEAETAEVAKGVAIIKDDCQRDLDEALPAYFNAVKALNSLDKKQIQEVKSFANPPKLVGVTLEAVCVLLGVKETWDDAKKLMNQSNFMEQLKGYDKDNIDPKIIKKVTKYIKDPEFTPETVSKVSQAALSLCLWVRAIFKYNEVAQTIAPKKAKLAEAEATLDAAQKTLESKRSALAVVLARVAELKASFQASLAKRDDLDRQSKMTTQRLERANKLTSGLGAEAERWQAAANQLEADLTNLVGNMILASGCIAYLGAFTTQYRSELIASWVKAAVALYIPVDMKFSLTRLMADPVVIRDWNILGLPADDFSTENGLFATMGRRWPLMVDPQGQANRWIKNLHKNDKLEVIKLSQPDFLRTLENAIRFGKPVLLENVEEALDPSLEPVLLKQTFKKGGQVLLRLGDTDVPFSEEFKFYITTKLANPHYLPEVCIKVTIINFTVTLRGLEDQLLVDVVRLERPDLEQKKDAMVVSIAADKKALKDIEDQILQMLADSKGDILDDEALINSLGQSKVTSNAIAQRMTEAEATTREITEARELYRPVATRGSILYFVIASMALCDSMYQFSLPAFSRLYNLRIERSAKSEVLATRLALLIDDITRSFFSNICRGLFEQHKLLYSFMIAADIMKTGGRISPAEWSMFLVGGTVKEAGGRNLPPAIAGWMTPQLWLNVLALDALPAFKGVAEDVGADADGSWAAVVASPTAATDVLPGRWGRVTGGVGTDAPDIPAVAGASLSTFQRLLITRLLREEKSVLAVREFVRAELGPFFCEPPPFDLDGAYGDSSAQTPLIFILSPGADPIDYLLKLAKSKNKSGPSFRVISLGQGQGPIAEAMMNAARASGDWVCLQNCHLSVSWLPKLEALLEATTGTGEHPDYRLWLTSMPSPAFPVSVLQNGVKITQEPPRGIKANLMRTFLDMGDKEYETSKKPPQFKQLLFGLAFYHALVLERRKFGPLGWNIPYDFMASDMKTATMQLRMYLDEQPGIPYETLRNVVGDISYGGRVTDKWDKRTNLSLLSRYFTPEILAEGAEPYMFAESNTYYAPSAPTRADVRKYIEGLPLDETPDVFGLHENASITLQMKETGELLGTLVSMQPRAGGGGDSGGPSNDDIVLEIVDSILSRLPPPMNVAVAHPSTFATDEAGNVNSLGVFLEQEMERFNELGSVLRRTLGQLKKAVKGLVVMSASLENMYNCFLFQRVPPEWENAAYPSLKPLGYWVESLYQRLDTLRGWLTGGPPTAYWISGFFFPQGFMTGALQMYARRTKIAIDALEFRTVVQPFYADAVPAAPAHGVYIYGLFLAGSRWDVPTGQLAEMEAGKLLSPLPCLWLEPALNKDINTGTAYVCPVYKTSRRAGTLSTTGHSTNFITTVFLPTSKSQDHWVRRGCALLSEDENSAMR